MSSAVNDEGVGRTGNALGSFLGGRRILEDSSILDWNIRRTHVQRSTGKLRPCLTGRELKVGNQGVTSDSERLETDGGNGNLESVDRTDEKSTDADKIADDESILAHDLAGKDQGKLSVGMQNPVGNVRIRTP